MMVVAAGCPALVTDVIRILSLRSVLATAVAVACFVVAAPASGASACAEQIIDDWADNAVIDGTYPVRCYRQAIAALPDDLLNYSSAADDIDRALQARLQGNADPGPPATSDGSGSSGGAAAQGGGGDERREPAGENSSSTAGAGPSRNDNEGEGRAGQSGDAQVSEGTVAAPAGNAFERDLGDGSGSLPAPVIALLAAAGALALGVAAWIVRRQLGRRRGPS